MTGRLLAMITNLVYLIGVLILKQIDYISADTFVISTIILSVNGILLYKYYGLD